MNALILALLAQDLAFPEKKLPSLPEHAQLSKIARVAKMSDFAVVVEAWHDGTSKFRVNGKECSEGDLNEFMAETIRGEGLYGKTREKAGVPPAEILKVELDASGAWKAGGKSGSDFESLLSLDLGKSGRVDLAITPDAPWREGVRVLYAAEILGRQEADRGRKVPFFLTRPKKMPAIRNHGSLKEKTVPKSLSADQLDDKIYPDLPEEKGSQFRRPAVLIAIAEDVDTAAFFRILEALLIPQLARIVVRVDLGILECTVLTFYSVVLRSYQWVGGAEYALALHEEVLRRIKTGKVTILDLASEEYMKDSGRAALRTMGFEIPDEAQITDWELKRFNEDVEKYQKEWIEQVQK